MTEAEEHKRIVQHFRTAYPEHERALRVSLAGLNFGSGPKAARMVNHVRSQGVVSGEADILIALPRHGFGSLVIEHKAAGSAHKATADQIGYVEYHNTNGNCACITRGVDAAIKAIDQYMAGDADEV